MSAIAVLYRLLPAALALSVSAMGQSAAVSQVPVPYASVSQLSILLDKLEQTTQMTATDLGSLRVEKWKTDSNSKRELQGKAEAIARNLQAALPGIVTKLRASPEDLSVTFNLYHNLDVIYDVLRSVTEAAQDYGSKNEFQSLANDLNGIDDARRNLAERMQNLATAKEAELGRLRSQIKAAQAAPPPPAKKIVVDDTQPAKQVKKKSKPAVTPSATNPATKQPPSTQPPPK
jgi:hypothetical protein